MSKDFLDKDFTITEENDNLVDIVESIKNYITDHDCPTLSMDISRLNILDASKITIVCSTYHWAKYPNGEISWKIGSSEVENLVILS